MRIRFISSVSKSCSLALFAQHSKENPALLLFSISREPPSPLSPALPLLVPHKQKMVPAYFSRQKKQRACNLPLLSITMCSHVVLPRLRARGSIQLHHCQKGISSQGHMIAVSISCLSHKPAQKKGASFLLCFLKAPVLERVAGQGLVTRRTRLHWLLLGHTSHGAFGSCQGQHTSGVFNGYNKLRFPDHPLTAVSFFLLHLEIASWFYLDRNWCQDSTAIVWLY